MFISLKMGLIKLTKMQNRTNRHKAIGSTVHIVFDGKLVPAKIYSITDTETEYGIQIDKIQVKLVDNSVYSHEFEIWSRLIMWDMDSKKEQK